MLVCPFGRTSKDADRTLSRGGCPYADRRFEVYYTHKGARIFVSRSSMRVAAIYSLCDDMTKLAHALYAKSLI